MNDLIGLRTKAGDKKSFVRVIKEIVACDNYEDFAQILLPDEVTVKKLKKENSDTSQFLRAVFKEWLEKNDDDHDDPAPSRTWSSLADSIELADLPGTLAKSIRDVCSSGTGELHHLFDINCNCYNYDCGCM